jgi:hypothetical protein
LTTKFGLAALLIGVAGVGNLLISGYSAYKPMTKEGAQDNTQRRKYDALLTANQAYETCVKKRGSGGMIIIPSNWDRMPPVTNSEPTVNCEASHKEALLIISTL